MIVDITNEVFTNLKNTLIDVEVLSAYPSTTPNFPCVTVEELSNISHIESIDTAGEKYSVFSIEINIFSDSPDKMSQAKSIRNRIDTIMTGDYGMVRGFGGRTPNPSDTNVYRYTLRYTGTINSNKQIYRR
jgi:hypothetical protein